jgi:hypothetical protein
MLIGVIGGPLLLAFALLVGTRIGRAISLIIGIGLVVSMINEPVSDQRAEAMKAGTFDCKSALEDDTKFKDDVWSYCSGVYGEAQWQAMVRAKTDAKWDALAKKEAADKAAYDAEQAGLTALGQRAAKR